MPYFGAYFTGWGRSWGGAWGGVDVADVTADFDVSEAPDTCEIRVRVPRLPVDGSFMPRVPIVADFDIAEAPDTAEFHAIAESWARLDNEFLLLGI